ncbi:MAG: hypothetical protein FWF29_00055 [Treponema sp.]|nr:hypothetical protein [Treponema sp.]
MKKGVCFFVIFVLLGVFSVGLFAQETSDEASQGITAETTSEAAVDIEAPQGITADTQPEAAAQTEPENLSPATETTANVEAPQGITADTTSETAADTQPEAAVQAEPANPQPTLTYVPENYTGKEIPNTVAAVKTAHAGDYILLKSGKKYVLTAEEIQIVRGDFNYDDLSGVKTEVRDDGTEVKAISEAHVVYAYPDGQFAHLLKTSTSFSAYMRYIQSKYYPALYRDYFGDFHDSFTLSRRSFRVFRAIIEIQPLSNDIDTLEGVTITAYNYKGEDFRMKYCSQPDMFWGNVSDEGAYRPTGESHQLEFDIE